MSLGDFLRNLILDSWYKVLVYVGGIILVLSLFVPAQGATNRQVQAVSGGALMLGLGVWIDQRSQKYIKSPNAYTGGAMLFTRQYWSPGWGVILDVSGIALMILGFLAVIG